MPTQRTPQGPGDAGRPKGLGKLLWPAAAVAFLVEALVLPPAASPFRAPKMALALAGFALTLFLPAALSLWAGALPKIRSRLVWPVLGLPVLQLLSVAWAPDRGTALATAAGTAIWCLLIFLLALTGREVIGRIAFWAAAGAALSAGVGFLQLLHLPVLVVDAKGRMAITGLTGNPADLAMAALLVLPFLLFAPEGSSGERSRSHLVMGGGLLAAAVATQTLAALAAGGLITAVWLFRRRSRRLTAAVVALILVVMASAAIGGVPGRLGSAFRQIRNHDWYQLFSARADGWTAAVEMIREHPLTGVGAGEFGHQFYAARLAWLERHGGHGARGELSTHFQWAHCDPLQLVAELGLPGLLWMAAFGVLFLPTPRGDPVAVAGLAVSLPFLLLHYPGHLAVGILPMTLLVAHILAGEPVEAPERARRWQRGVAVAAAVAALAAGWWQLGVIRNNLWQGSLGRVLDQAVAMPEPARRRTLQAITDSIRHRMETHPGQRKALAVPLGNALLAAGEPVQAERAFRRAYREAPSAAAELGLGLALAAQGRTPEALRHLARAGRVNPVLLDAVPDLELRKAALRMATSR